MSGKGRLNAWVSLLIWASGDGREILQAQVAAYTRLGDEPRRMAARAELDRLIASRLF